MKIQELFENRSNFNGGYFYSLYGDDHKAAATEAIKRFKNVKIVKNKLASDDFQEIVQCVEAMRDKVQLNEEIYYKSGTISQYDFSNFPTEIETDFFLEDNFKADNFKNIHKHFIKINGELFFSGLQIKSHILGLLKIRGLTNISMGGPFRVKYGWTLQDIMNKYLEGDRDLIACQQELIEAGYEEYAQL